MKIIYLVMGNGLSSEFGGSIIRTLNIIKNLEEKKDVKILIITTVGGKFACKKEGIKSKIMEIPCSLKAKEENTIFDRFTAYIISTIIFPFYLHRIPKYDIVYTDSDYFCDVFPVLFIKIVNPRILWISMVHHKISVFYTSFLGFFTTLLSKLAQEINFFIIKLFSYAVFLYDSPTGHKIRNDFFRNKKVLFVYNGVDIKKIKKLKLASTKSQFDACFIGGIRPNKGLYDIIPVWRKVTSKNESAKLAIIGNGVQEYINYLHTEIDKHNLGDNIQFLGPQDNLTTLKLLNNSKILFFPSHEEGWGIVMCEALALEKPIVCYDLEVFSIFKGDSIFRVKCFDLNSFAAKTVELINMKGNYSESNINLFNWGVISSKEHNFFKKTLLETTN